MSLRPFDSIGFNYQRIQRAPPFASRGCFLPRKAYHTSALCQPIEPLSKRISLSFEPTKIIQNQRIHNGYAMLNMFLPFSATFIHFQSQWHNALGVFGIGATTNMSILVVLMADICKRDQTCVCSWKSPVLVVIIRPLLSSSIPHK